MAVENQEEELSSLPVPQQKVTPVRLTWENLTYTVEISEKDENGKTVHKDKPLIRDVNGSALPGRLLAIMGPSGAGKTTFLNTISGRVLIDKTHRVSGCAFLNNVVMSEDYRGCISYVAQDDIIMGKETPRDALKFSYQMRTGASGEEADAQTVEMLKKLHLTTAADTIMGIPGLIKGVSGGEKKRTNIGSELIRNPRIMILDEPTTGLDSVNAERVGNLLHQLAAEEGRTVLCTIHTPSSELFNHFDDVMLMARGRVAYHGPRASAPAYFASVGHHLPPRYNPSEFYMNLLQLPEAEVEDLLDAWAKHCATAEALSNASIQPMTSVIVSRDEELHRAASLTKAGFGLQLGLLCKRALRLYSRDPGSTIGRLIQTLFFAILIGLFFLRLADTSNEVQSFLGALFMMAVNTVFLSVMSGVAAFPPERAVFLQEQSNDMYSPWIYFFAKTVAETPFQIAFPVLYSVIVYWMVGLHPSAGAFFAFLLVIIVIANTAYSFGLLAAAFFPDPAIAMALVPLVMLPMFVVGGLFANTERLEPAWVWLNYLSFIRYTFTALVDIEFSRIGSLCDPGSVCQYQNGREVIGFLGFENMPWGRSVGILIGIMAAFRLFAAFALWRQSAATRSRMQFQHNAVSRQASPLGAQSPRLQVEG